MSADKAKAWLKKDAELSSMVDPNKIFSGLAYISEDNFSEGNEMPVLPGKGIGDKYGGHERRSTVRQYRAQGNHEYTPC